MRQQLPETFVRSTRWAYLRERIEVGPFEATEILQLLAKREIGPDTILVELNSRRMSAAREVGPFASFMLGIVEDDRRQKRDREFEQTRERVARAAKLRILLWGGGLALLVAVAAVVIAVVNPFKPEGPKFVVDTTAAVPEQTQELNDGAKTAQPEFTIRESDEQEAEAEAEAKLVEAVKAEQLMSAGADSIINGNHKLEGPAKAPSLPKTKKNPGGPQNGTGSAGTVEVPTALSGAESIATLDFTDDEEEEGEEGEGGNGSAGLARHRLAEAVRKCTRQVMTKYQDSDVTQVSASAVLQSSGRMSGLKLDVTPALHVGDLKMCAAVELARMRVPPSESDDTAISVSFTVSALD